MCCVHTLLEYTVCTQLCPRSELRYSVHVQLYILQLYYLGTQLYELVPGQYELVLSSGVLECTQPESSSVCTRVPAYSRDSTTVNLLLNVRLYTQYLRYMYNI